jgi:hypothetical protein
MKYDEIKTAWNAQAEDEKQWNSLTEAEKVEWAARLGAEKERGPAPIFNQDAQKTLHHLQRKGFNVVGYALEHCNDWTDNRRCTVDSKGLVRWMPSADQEVAVERAARQKAQAEVAELKERIARAGVDHRRALREACAQVQEAALKVVSDALNDLVEACHGHDGKLKTPDKKELMRARSMLPPRCSYTLTKKI